MLNGITILAISEGYVKSWGMTPVIMLTLLLGISFVILSIYIGADKGDDMQLLFVFGSILIAISIIASSKAKIIDTYTVYKVTVDETVSLQKFNEKYEIISQEGLIYEIKEKRVDTN